MNVHVLAVASSGFGKLARRFGCGVVVLGIMMHVGMKALCHRLVPVSLQNNEWEGLRRTGTGR